MRVYLLWLLISMLSVYALRDYFKPTLFLILMMAFYGHEDMPSNIAGIQGLNPWNLLMVFCVAGYILNKKQEGASFDLPSGISVLFFLFVFFSLTSTTRMILDFDTLEGLGYHYTKGELIAEYYLNQTKWLVPAFLLYCGARTPERRWFALAAIIAVNLLIAAITIRRVPLGSVVSGEALTQHGLKVLEQAFGWSRVNTAMLLAGAAWAVLWSTGYLIRNQPLVAMKFELKWLPPVLFGVTSVALALTGGRMGWGAWVALAFVFTAWRWRKGLFIMPIVIASVIALVPALQERLLQGVSTEGGTQIEDSGELTSGRTEAWPIVIDKISQKPILGWGGLAMQRSGAEKEVMRAANIPEGERGFPHPHNAYLHILLDSGIVGAIPIVLLYLLILIRAWQICRVDNAEATAIGMATVSIVLALLVAGMGSQYFYPVQGTIALWAAVGLTLRMHTDIFVLGKVPEAVATPINKGAPRVAGHSTEGALVQPLWTRAKGSSR